MLYNLQDSIDMYDIQPRRNYKKRGTEQKHQPEYQLPPIEIEDIINQEELKNFLDDLKCPICINVIEDPKTCINCEANFCAQCIQKWVSHQGQKQCPCCRDQGQERFLHPNKINNRFSIRQYEEHRNQDNYVACPKIFKKILSTIQITCHNKGCDTIIKYDERLGHVKVCMYQLRNCSNNQCQEKVTLLTEPEHIKVCEYRKVPCKYCQQQICFQDMIFHEDFCPENKKKCPDCKIEYQIQRIDEHEKVCPYKKILCKICNNHFYQKNFSYHTKAKCYQTLYMNSQRDLKKKDRVIEQKNNRMEKMENLIQLLKSQLQAEGEVDKKQLVEQIDEFYQNNKIEDQQKQEEEQISENYPDDFESFEKTLNMFVDEDNYEKDILYFQPVKQISGKKSCFTKIQINADFENNSYQNYDCSIQSIKAQPQSEISQINCNNNNSSSNNNNQNTNYNYIKRSNSSQLSSTSGILSQQDEEEQKNDSERNKRNQFYESSLNTLQEFNQNLNNVGNYNNSNNYQNIFQTKYDDSYFKEIFGNSQDRKDFFDGIEENLFL
ncbi:hypothetical protein ABPG74_022454 [Tetrahymena malaccensis]